MISPIRYTTIAGIVAAAFLTGWWPCAAAAGGPYTHPTPAQIRQTHEQLADARYAPAPSIEDRDFWDSLRMQATIREAEQIAAQEVPLITEDDYLAYSRTGDRKRFTRLRRLRLANLSTLTLAECMADEGRFLPLIADYVDSYLRLPSWTDSAHDKRLRVYNGELIGIDLFAAENGLLLSSVYALLGPRLDDTLRTELLQQIDRRITQPYLAACREPSGDASYSFWWLNSGHNWNSVCTAGVLYATLVTSDSSATRAEAVACGLSGLRHYLDGFSEDGYCSEGMHYWEFGFGNYLFLGEVLKSHSAGRIDLFAEPLVTEIAQFPIRMALVGDVYPAYSDSKISDRPSYYSRLALARHFGVPSTADPRRRHEGLLWQVLLNNSLETPPASQAEPPAPRSWYEAANVFVFRSGPDPKGLYASIKAGHNGEFHNHNDVGSYVVRLSGLMPCIDPGPEFYTSRTFSEQRYVSGLINSRGHAVPLVDGGMQRVGRQAEGRLVSKSFGDDKDTVFIDLSSAYDAPTMRSLRRRFEFDRTGQTLRVADEVAFSQPCRFGTALITYEDYEIVSPELVRIFSEDAVVDVTIESPGRVQVTAEVIDEDAVSGMRPVRIGIDFERPIRRGEIALRYERVR